MMIRIMANGIKETVYTDAKHNKATKRAGNNSKKKQTNKLKILKIMA
jgi:hypothetical protein